MHARAAHTAQLFGITKLEVAEITPSSFVITKHTGGSCPLLKVETAKKLIELLGKREEAAKKRE